MKKTCIFLVAVLLVSSPVFALDKEELKKSIKDLTVDDLIAINDETGAKMLDTAVETGYVKGSNFGGAGGFYYFLPSKINENNASGLGNIPALTGGAGGFVVNIDKNWAWGVLFGGMGGEVTRSIGSTTFESFSAAAGFAIPYVKYRPLITPKLIMDVNLGIGSMMGGYTYSKVDEGNAASDKDVVRNGYAYPLWLEIEARYRILPAWFAGVNMGYLSAVISELKRADYVDSSAKPLDFSGLFVAVTMGGNF